MLPTSMLIGVQDGGWELLAHDLASHPDVTMADDGPGVLLTNEGQRAQDLFARRFGPTTRACSLEVAPSLLAADHSAEMADRALAVCGPELRILVMLNHPVERLRLHHRRLALAEKAPDHLGAALQELPGLVDDSCYDDLLAPWFANFRPWAIHVVVAEDYVAGDPQSIEGLCRHLGIDPTRAPQMSPVARARRRRIERRVLAEASSAKRIDSARWRRAVGSVLVPPPAASPSRELLGWLEPELRHQTQLLSLRCGWAESRWPMQHSVAFLDGSEVTHDITDPASAPFDLTEQLALTDDVPGGVSRVAEEPLADLRAAEERDRA